MFGSVGFLIRGNLCIGCGLKRIMCRIDPELHDKALTQSGCRTVVMRGHEYRGWIYVDADAVHTQRSLKHWSTWHWRITPRFQRKEVELQLLPVPSRN